MAQLSGLYSKRVKWGKRFYYFDLIKHEKFGRFLKITESIREGDGYRRQSVLVTESGLEIFREALDEVIHELRTRAA